MRFIRTLFPTFHYNFYPHLFFLTHPQHTFSPFVWKNYYHTCTQTHVSLPTTNEIIPRSRILLEKQLGLQLAKELPEFCGT